MVSILFVGSAVISVLAVCTVIGRLAVPPRERVALHRLGWAGWLHTLRRSTALLGESTPAVRSARPPHATGDGTARAVSPAGVGSPGDRPGRMPHTGATTCSR